MGCSCKSLLLFCSLIFSHQHSYLPLSLSDLQSVGINTIRMSVGQPAVLSEDLRDVSRDIEANTGHVPSGDT